jgi:hypothetical protein
MFPLVPGKGISLASKLGVSLATRKKTRLDDSLIQPQIQARPCLIVLAARPGNFRNEAFQF